MTLVRIQPSASDNMKMKMANIHLYYSKGTMVRQWRCLILCLIILAAGSYTHAGVQAASDSSVSADLIPNQEYPQDHIHQADFDPAGRGSVLEGTADSTADEKKKTDSDNQSGSALDETAGSILSLKNIAFFVLTIAIFIYISRRFWWVGAIVSVFRFFTT